MLKEKHWKTVYIHLKNNTLQFSSRRKVAYLDMLRAQKENNGVKRECDVNSTFSTTSTITIVMISPSP